MKVFVIFLILVGVAVAQYEPQGIPIPYSFSYSANGEDGGQSSHQESGDGAGRVSGSYSVRNLEGHERVVEYVADEGGFRPVIRTNEPGTASVNPADVVIESSADQGGAPVSSGLGVRSVVARPVAVAPVAPVAPASAGRRAGVRYVLVPATDPRARGYN
ncbi:cuticle protein 10.9-like [Stegodyphus dumicola]|uniref:cuticle protein 10.9-like n=1 Tax=Stegodyphus dumicola TaxID=202533 RepID=UPI0015A80AF5|nr:cuticle protein 10.9-like [Stegodyphus dumicola]